MKPERGDVRRRVRLTLGWLFTALLVGIYFLLPDGDQANSLDTSSEAVEVPQEPERLDVVEISPATASPGSAVTVHYTGAKDEAGLKVFIGKEEIEVLARREGSVVARLPREARLGRVKLRVAADGERSKPFQLRLEPTDWRKPYRSLVGGFALLVFGIGVFARGAREAAGRDSARALARLARRGPAALGLGTVLGSLAQSTTAAAALLAGLVTSSLLAVGPAAAAFLGAQLGAAAVPLVTGLIDLRGGLLIVAIGVLWMAFASDRRATAISRLVLGAGLIAFGLQTLRPGFEPFVQDPTLLSLVGQLKADSVLDIALCALLGALLVAMLQGPAPVVVLVLVLAQTTAQWDLRTALAVLSGSGLGSAIGALLTTPRGRRGRKLAELYLALGVLGTLFAASTVDIWTALTARIVPAVSQESALLPHLGLHLGVAFALSQLASALLLLPLVPRILKLLDRMFPESRMPELKKIGDAPGVVRSGLLQVVAIEHNGLQRLSDLVIDGRRDAGRHTEHRLADAHARLSELLSGPVLVLPHTLEGGILSRAAFVSLGLLRALEGLHRQAERLTDTRLAAAEGESELTPLPNEEAEVLSEMHALLETALSEVQVALQTKEPVELEGALTREIRMNGLEARARSALQRDSLAPGLGLEHLRVLELVDAYESAGNQAYRLAEALGESYAQPSAAVV